MDQKTSSDLNNQDSNEYNKKSHWAIWLLAGLAVLFIIIIIILRGLCTDVWYIRLLGLNDKLCGSGSGESSSVSSPQKLSFANGVLTIGSTGSDSVPIVLESNGKEGAAGATGARGSDGSRGVAGAQGSNGATGATGPVGPAGPATGIVTNTLTSAANSMTSTVNGVASLPANIVNSINLNSLANNLNVSVNGVTSANVPIINTVSNSSIGNNLSTTVNGVVGVAVPIINSNTVALTQAGGLTTTVNGVGSNQAIPAGVTTQLLGYDAVGNATYQDAATVVATYAITSINAQTGPSITITGTGPITATTGLNTIDLSCATCLVTGNALFTAAADAGPSQTVSQGDTLSLIGGAGLTTTASAVDTVTFDVGAGNGITVNANNVAINSPTCVAGEYLQWNGAAFVCTLTTNTLVNNGVNTLTSTVNGVASAALMINSVSNTSVGNTISTTVNGVTGLAVPLINSNTFSFDQATGFTSTVNGLASNQAIAAGSIAQVIGFGAGGTPIFESPAAFLAANTTNSLVNNGVNTLTSTVNGVASAALMINSVSNTSVGNTISTTVNGVTGVAVPIINSNTFSWNPVTSSLTSDVNGVASSAVLTCPNAAPGDFFCQNGNSFGALAVLGTNDANNLEFETNNVSSMLIDTLGNASLNHLATTGAFAVPTFATSQSNFVIPTASLLPGVSAFTNSESNIVLTEGTTFNDSDENFGIYKGSLLTNSDGNMMFSTFSNLNSASGFIGRFVFSTSTTSSNFIGNFTSTTMTGSTGISGLSSGAGSAITNSTRDIVNLRFAAVDTISDSMVNSLNVNVTNASGSILNVSNGVAGITMTNIAQSAVYGLASDADDINNANVFAFGSTLSNIAFSNVISGGTTADNINVSQVLLANNVGTGVNTVSSFTGEISGSEVTNLIGGVGDIRFASTVTNATNIFGDILGTTLNNAQDLHGRYTNSTVVDSSQMQALMTNTTVNNNSIHLVGFINNATISATSDFVGYVQNSNITSSDSLHAFIDSGSNILNSNRLNGLFVTMPVTNSNYIQATAFSGTIDDSDFTNIVGSGLTVSATDYSDLQASNSSFTTNNYLSANGNNLSVNQVNHSNIIGDNLTVASAAGNDQFDYAYIGADGAGTINTLLNFNGFDSYINQGAGNLGVGTNAPAAKLDVRAANGVSGTGVAQVTNTNNTNTSDGIIVTAGSNAGSGAQLMQFKRPDGTVIGSITQATATTVAFNTTSDERLKENIVDTGFNLDTVLAIKVHDYDYKADPDQTKITGFIAQELYKLFPQAVSVGTDAVDANGNLTNPWQVDYSKLTPILTKGIQDLNAKLEDSAKLQNGKIEDINTQLASQGIQVVSLGDELAKLSKRVDTAEEDIKALKARVEELEKAQSPAATSPTTPTTTTP